MLKRLLAMCALIPGIALGQAARYDGNVTTYATNVPTGAQANVLTVPNAIVTVCAYPAVGTPCTNTVNIYSDQGLTHSINNPLQTDSVGRFGFWILGGLYSYSVQKSDGTNVGNFPFSGVAPSGGTFQPAINTVQYVNPASSTDLITQVNALFTACSFNCEVHIPTGDYTVASGTILINSPTESLTADGKGKVRITYAGTNFLDARLAGTCPSVGCYDFTPNISVSGFTVTCTNMAAKCITSGSIIGVQWRDLNVYGPGGIASQNPVGTSQGFVFQNTYDWMERWIMEDINIGGFQTNIHFMAPLTGGTDSYGYGLLKGVWTAQGPASYGVVVDPGATVYNLLGFDYQFNLANTTPGDGTSVFLIGGTLTGEGFHVTGENAGATYNFAHITQSGSAVGQMGFYGDYETFGPGATGLVVVDANAVQGATNPGTGSPNPNVPFYVGPPRMGSRFGASGIPTLNNYDGSGQNFSVYPWGILDVTAPTASRFGFLESATGLNSPYISYDPGSKFCLFTKNPLTTEAALTPTHCIDGAGNTTETSIKLGSTAVISSITKFTSVLAPTGTVAAQSCSDLTVTVTGLSNTDDITQIRSSTSFGSLSMSANSDPFVANKLDLHYCNPTSASVAVPAATYQFTAIH